MALTRSTVDVCGKKSNKFNLYLYNCQGVEVFFVLGTPKSMSVFGLAFVRLGRSLCIEKCPCLEFGVDLSICRFREVSDWTGSTVFIIVLVSLKINLKFDRLRELDQTHGNPCTFNLECASRRKKSLSSLEIAGKWHSVPCVSLEKKIKLNFCAIIVACKL